MRALIRRIIPKGLRAFYRRLNPPPKQFGWFGDYPDWNSAAAECAGYEADNILEAVKRSVLQVKKGTAAYERDSVLFDEVQLSGPLLKALQDAANEAGGKLHVTDFGGSLGSTFFQNRAQLKDVKDLRWTVVEQKHFVDCGKREIAGNGLDFAHTVDESLTRQDAQVLLLSSVVQYFEKPYELLAELQAKQFRYIIVDRTAFIDGRRERITRQVVPPSIYIASYPAWFLNEQKFVNAFAAGYSLITEFDSKFDPEEILDGQRCYRKGFVFKRKA
jgi:putative methyltransferase (TIGR04325 family)